MNSLSEDTLHELRDISDILKNDKDIWLIVLEGEGSHFSAGADKNLFKPLGKSDAETFKKNLLDLQLCIDAFEAVKKPKIAKIKGYCIGGGLILAACCDFRIAAEDAIFSLPEVRLGIAVLMGTQRISKLAGIPATKEMILLAENFSAIQAKAYNLLNQVVSLESLDESVKNLTDKLKALPPKTLAIANQIIDEGYQMTLRQSQDLEIELQSSILGSTDWIEAVMSRFEKRSPKFRGE